MSVKKIENLNKHENPATNTNPFNIDAYLNDNWDKVKDTVDNNADELTVAQQDIAEIKAKNTEQDGRIETNEINIQSLQTDNTTNKQDILDIKQEQTTQNTNIEQNTSNIATINEEIANIHEKDTAQDTNIETLTQRLNEKDNQIAELKAENEDLKADLSNSQIHGQASGEYVHLVDSAKMNCEIAILGNSKQETGDVTDEEGNVIGTMPSLDYPSEIESVESSANVKVWNKNWFSTNVTNKSISSSNVKSTEIENGVRISYSGSTSSTYLGYIYIIKDIRNYVGKTLAVSAKAKASASNNTRMNLVLCDENGGNRKVLKSSDLSNVEINATIPETEGDVHFLGIVFYANVDGTIAKDDYVDYTDIQVEEDVITDYIPHEEQNYTVDMQEPFRAIGDVIDCFVLKEDGKWYERHKIIGKTITGEDIGTPLSNNRFPVLYEKIIPYIKPLEAKYYYTAIPENNIKSNIASPLINKSLTNLSAIEKGNYITTWNNTSYAFMLKTDKEMTKEEAVAYFNENPFYIEYIAETPTDIECTEQQTQQLQALQKAKTYKNITNITTDTIAVLDVDYKKDLETYQKQQDDRITAIEQLLTTTATSAMLLDNVQSDLESEVK